MTRTRARRLLRTGFWLCAAVAAASCADMAASNHGIAAGGCGIVCGFAVFFAYVVGTDGARRHHRRDYARRIARPQSPPREHPGLGEYPQEVAMFRAQISEWEASQRSQP